jgi:anti-sigma B factor antagonist
VTHLAARPDSDWQPFRCEVTPDRDIVRVKPVGELDLATVDQLATPVRELCQAGFTTLVIDLSELAFIDSTGIRALLEAQTTAERHEVALRVLPGPPVVQRALEITGVGDVLFP